MHDWNGQKKAKVDTETIQTNSYRLPFSAILIVSLNTHQKCYAELISKCQIQVVKRIKKENVITYNTTRAHEYNDCSSARE